MLETNQAGFFPYTPATNLLYGLREAIAMLHEEGLDNVFARHQRPAAATRRGGRAWGLDVLCRSRRSTRVLTAVMMPDGHDADAFRRSCSTRFDMSLGTGLGKLKGKVFRIGHLGDFNDLMLAGTLGGVEMGLASRACRTQRRRRRRHGCAQRRRCGRQHAAGESGRGVEGFENS